MDTNIGQINASSRNKEVLSGFGIACTQSMVKLEKVSNDDWDSPKRDRGVNKAKEAENSEDESDKHSSE